MPLRPRYVSSSVAALVLGLSAFPLAAQPCHPLTPELRASIAAVERFLSEVDAPLPVRRSDQITDRELVQVGGRPVHVMGRSTQEDTRRLRASVRRIAARLDTALRELGPRVDQRPVYFVPFDSSSYALPDGSVSLGETRCYDEPGLLYGRPGEDGSVPGNACVVVIFASEVPDDEELDFVLAHEWFHVVQNASFPADAHSCRSAWWREGAANWFAHVVLGADPRPEETARFLEQVTRRSLTDFSYEAQVFHFWAGQRFGKPWVFELGLRPDARLATPGAVTDIMAADDWQAWAEAIADGTVTYPDGRPIAAFPVAPTMHAIGEADAVTLAGPPLSVHLATVTTTRAGLYDVEYAPAGALVSVAPETGLPMRAAWTRIDADGTRRSEARSCEAPAWRIAAIRLGAAPLAATLRYQTRESQGCDACYYGTWTELVERRPDDVRIATPGGPGIVMTHVMRSPHDLVSHLPDGTRVRRTWMGDPVLVVNRDGTYTLDDPRTTTTTSADGQPIVTSVDRTYREAGTWTPAEEGRVAVQRQRREVRGTQAAAGVSSPYSEDRRLRGAPVRYVPVCSATRMELWLPPIWTLRAEQARRPDPGGEPARPARVFRRP